MIKRNEHEENSKFLRSNKYNDRLNENQQEMAVLLLSKKTLFFFGCARIRN